MTQPTRDDAEVFLVAMADALHRQGLPSSRVERVVSEMAAQLGAQCTLFSTPTSLLVAFGDPPAQRVTILRVEPADIDLGRLADLDDLAGEVSRGLGLKEARRRLGEIQTADRRWPIWTDLVCSLIASSGACVLFGGGARDLVAAGALGVVTAILWLLSERFSGLSESWMTIASFIAIASSSWLGSYVPGLHPGVVALSGIILLVPGLSFTLGMVELASRSLTSGVASIAGACVTLFKLGLGVAIADYVIPQTTGLPAPAEALPSWVLPVVLAFTPPAFGEMMRARAGDLPEIAVFSLLAYAGVLIGDAWLGSVAGAGLGAAVLGVSTNLYGRYTGRPAIIPMVTGMLLLVPGSVGFRSIAALLDRDIMVGVEEAFHMLMVAGSLAGGFVASNAIVRAKRGL